MDDKKNIILAVLLTAAILFGWPYISEHFFPAANPPATKIEGGKTTPVASPTTDPAADGPVATRDLALAGADVVITAAHFATVPASAIVGPVKQAGVKRLLVVGGAGSLLLPDDTRVIDSAGFPAEYKTEASAGAAFLDALRQEKELVKYIIKIVVITNIIMIQ